MNGIKDDRVGETQELADGALRCTLLSTPPPLNDTLRALACKTCHASAKTVPAQSAEHFIWTATINCTVHFISTPAEIFDSRPETRVKDLGRSHRPMRQSLLGSTEGTLAHVTPNVGSDGQAKLQKAESFMLRV